ncbi:MAG: hypothetical protein OIN84_04090 [Candidatus Methanoperedens sp.]|nr:hypothetical protein [Candidatus Methanoperedens sp.]
MSVPPQPVPAVYLRSSGGGDKHGIMKNEGDWHTQDKEKSMR